MLVLKKSRKSKKFFLILFIFSFFRLMDFTNAETLKGDFIQGGLIFGKTNPGNTIFYNNLKVPIDEKGEFIFGLGRKHPKFGVIKTINPNGKATTKQIEIKQRKYYIQRINNLEKNKVTPPEKFYKRIKREVNRIKKAKSTEVKEPFYYEGFTMPAEGTITGVYGSQRVLNGIPKRPHYGIDIANKIGTPILAPSDGVIVLVEKDLYFSGGTIIISHGRGLTSSLLHLKDILVEENNLVKKGQVVGLMGDTGRATGSHLDWRMELRGIRIDPYLLIKK